MDFTDFSSGLCRRLMAVVSTVVLGLCFACDSGSPNGDEVPATDAVVGSDSALSDMGVDPPDAMSVDAAERDAMSADAGTVEPIWERLAPVETGPIQEVAVVALDGEMYVIGGFDGRGRIVNQVSVYNPETDTWRRAADLPVAMHHANAAAVDGRIYVLGFLVRGFEEDGRGYIYDPDEDAWTEGPSLPATTHRGASGMAVVGSNIYLLGGFGGGGAVSLMSAYDVESGQWAELPDLPGPPRDHMAVGVVDGQIILAGGRSGRINSHINRVDVFDPATGDWRTAAPMPTSRGGVAAAASGPWFYVVGGEGNGDTATGVFDNVEAYHLPTDSWSVLPAMDTPRHGTGAVVIGDWLYVPGGAVTQAFGADDTHERLRVLP